MIDTLDAEAEHLCDTARSGQARDTVPSEVVNRRNDCMGRESRHERTNSSTHEVTGRQCRGRVPDVIRDDARPNHRRKSSRASNQIQQGQRRWHARAPRFWDHCFFHGRIIVITFDVPVGNKQRRIANA